MQWKHIIRNCTSRFGSLDIPYICVQILGQIFYQVVDQGFWEENLDKILYGVQVYRTLRKKPRKMIRHLEH